MNLVQGNNYGTPADYPTPAQQAQGLVCGSVISIRECIKKIPKPSLACHMAVSAHNARSLLDL